MIADFEGDITELLKDRDSGTYPIICTRDLVIFPTVLTPIILGRKQSIAVVDYLKQKHDDLIFCAFTQKDANLDDPEKEDLYETGVFCRLIKMVELPGQPNGQVTIVVQGLGKCKLKSIDTKDHSIADMWKTFLKNGLKKRIRNSNFCKVLCSLKPSS